MKETRRCLFKPCHGISPRNFIKDSSLSRETKNSNEPNINKDLCISNVPCLSIFKLTRHSSP